MATKKRSEGKSAQTTAPAQSGERKRWKKKTPVEVFLDQEEKLRKEVEDTEADLEKKRAQLRKFQEARKVFESS